MRPVALSFLGAVEAACGAPEEGVAMLERAVALAAEMGFLFQQDVRVRERERALKLVGWRPKPPDS